mmetsp:Transcript_17842/g.34757  ORF Transcript_17842/g.34757 Transcript_17842/m.34757 type:complete len:124 (+) Transcript_17842:127-498(+)
MCEPTYSKEYFEQAGISVHEMTFADGGTPPDDVLEAWRQLIVRRYKARTPADAGVVAVHCAAGLGRAPVMAAIALIEIGALDAISAIEKIREKLRGAINMRQFTFLQSYKRTVKSGKGNCAVM